MTDLAWFCQGVGYCQDVACEPFGPWVALARYDSGNRLFGVDTVTVWDGHTGAVQAVYDWGMPSPKAVAFAPDGLTLAASGSDGRVVVWDVEA